MDSTEKRMNIQCDSYENIQRAYANFKKAPKERITVGYLTSRLESLEVYWKDFKCLHQNIIQEKSKEERKSCYYFDYEVYDHFEELYYTYKGELRNSLQKLQPNTDTENKSQQLEQRVCQKPNDTKLPRITIPIFSGDYTEWQSFHDLFLALIHKNDTLEDVQKLHYLKSNLKGDAEVLLRQFAITGENYAEAWSVLKRRYDNKRYIANCIFKKFFSQKTLPYESANLLKQLLDTSVECINALKNLGLPTSHWDAIVNFVIVSKLDTVTHKQWEESIGKNNTEDLPSFQQLKEFLETKFRTLEMVEPAKKITKTINPRSFHAADGVNVPCSYCKEKHYIFNCKKFVKQPTEERYRFVQSNNLCFNCLMPNHTVPKCKNTISCKICKKRHHSLLHNDRKHLTTNEKLTTEGTTLKQQDEIETKVTAHMSKEQPGQRILLATALVDITSRTGQTHVFRALIDQGSEASFVTSRVVDLLGLRRTNINGVVSGVGGEGRICINHMAELVVKSKCTSNFSVKIKAYVLKSLTRRLPAKEVKICGWPQLNGMELADPHFHTPSRIDILLGADVFCKIIGSGLIRGPGDLVAQYTSLGWILSGSVSKSVNGSPQITSLHVTRLDDETNNLLRKFWEIDVEHYRSKKILTKEETKCEEIYKNTTTRDETGRYVVQLPLKQSYEDTVRMCGDTKKLAVTRLESLEKRFRKNETLKIAYKEVIHEYLRLGHMMRVEDESDESTVYLAHHPVIREDKDTTKIRVVFDASAQGTGGYSLNDCMMIGPVLQPDLRSIIVRWRTHKICVIGDIIKMYRQVRVTDDHANLQRIVWRDEENEEFKSYKLMTVTFGTAAAPYLAVRTLCQLAKEEAEEYPDSSSVIKNSFYVDDLMSGNENIEKTKRMCVEIKGILRKGGFEMQKWSSNCEEVLDFLQEREFIMKEKLDIKLDKVIKILGLTWDRKDDKFKITVNLPEIQGPITKRSVLSDVARLFDPFGWLSPVVITAKILIQKLWICNLGWDDELPPQLIEDWLRYRKELIHLQHISLPRWFNTTSQNLEDMEIHGFADASENAYAAVVYLKVINNASIHVMIIASRTKVAPLKQISVPKLELCAAALLAELMSDVVNLLSISKEKIFAWSDSMVVLSWLQSEPSRWRTFVANRVSEITRVLDNNHWNYVQSTDNPADLATRGIKAYDLANQDIWWSGPDWLKQIQIEKDTLEIPQTELEIKNTFHSHFEGEPIWQRFSSLTKMKRVLAYCRRLLPNKQKKESYLTVDEMNLIETRCIKFYQGQIYRQEIECLERDGRVRSGSSLANLTPYLDERGLLRVAGRLNNAEYLSTNTKHPIIIPAKQHVTTLIINDGHAKTLHGGVLQTMAFIRRKFWVINLKSAVRGFIRNCTTCIRDQAKTKQQLMGQLPAPRVTPSRAFSSSGVDYAGPIQVRTSKGRGHKSSKGYICLFVCMSTKAIHLECVTDLTSQAFIAAFRRFVARRGHCSHLWSDNGTNFVGAARELKHMFEIGKNNMAKEIAELLANDGTTWHFIPPKAPNFGGLWEAGVKSAKQHLSRISGATRLTYEEMTTLLAQIEACLNSRPLCQMDDTLETLDPLTPGHFLIGEPLIGLPENDYVSKNVNLLTRWQFIQNRIQAFWKRWQADYLQTLQQRYKWQRVAQSPSIGDIVIIKEEDLPPCKWLLGKIITLHPGPDTLVRVVSVRCKGNVVMKRPLSKLILLPIKPEN